MISNISKKRTLCPLKDTEFYRKQGGENCKKPVIYAGFFMCYISVVFMKIPVSLCLIALIRLRIIILPACP